jgi:hypothetical protein
MSDIPKTPTLEKMQSIHQESQAIGEFLEWLPDIGIKLCEWDDEAPGPTKYWPVSKTIERLLSWYFEIDLDKADDEKRSLLEWMRENNG